jgi:hypothetical protein
MSFVLEVWWGSVKQFIWLKVAGKEGWGLSLAVLYLIKKENILG